MCECKKNDKYQVWLRIRRVYSKETQIVMAAPQLNNSMEGFHRLSEHKPCCEHFSYEVCNGT